MIDWPNVAGVARLEATLVVAGSPLPDHLRDVAEVRVREVVVAAIDGRDRVAADRRPLAVNVAWSTPFTRLSVPLPKDVAPSLKVTVPVGLPCD